MQNELKRSKEKKINGQHLKTKKNKIDQNIS